MKVVLLLIRKSVSNFSIAVIASVISGGAYALTIKELHQAINSAEVLDMTFLYKIVGLILFSSAAAMVSSYRLSRLSEKTAHDLRLDLSKKLMKADFEKVEQKSLRIIPVLTADIRVLGDFIQKMPEMLTALAKAIGCIAYMFWISWELTTITLLTFGVIFIIIMFILPIIQRHERSFRKLRNQVFEHLRGLVNGMKELTINQQHQLSYVGDVLGPASLQQSSHQIWINVLNTVTTKIGEIVFIALVAGLLVYLSTSNFLSTSLFVEYLMLLLFVLPSLILIVAFFRNLKKVEASLEQIDSLGLQMQDDGPDGTKPIEHASKPALVTMEEVKYQYFDHNKKTFKIGPINLRIEHNELLFIIGGNGSGKTSLAKLITGLYQPTGGKIYYGNTLITDENLQSYRNKFSALFADSHVFPDLNYIEENRLNDHAPELIKGLNIEDKVSVEEKRLTETNLSFGQRGRLSMLRALLEDNEIYLFDEWAANQDPHFKKKFYREILPDLKVRGKTVIAITHDEAYFDVADRLIKLDYGVIKEMEAASV